MIVERPAAARGRVRNDWLDSRHTFSFGRYHDPAWMGFGALRVINEDRVAPGGGFSSHRHANMEILSYVLSGALAHRDNASGEEAGGGVLTPGQLQWMSAGHGIEHSEFNASSSEPVHFLQIWLQPDRVNAAPAYEQRTFDPVARRGRWATLAAPEGAEGGLPIRQQAWLRGTLLAAGEQVAFELDPQRRYWLQLAQGEVEVDGHRLVAGDGRGYQDAAGTLQLTGAGQGLADLLLFELPS